MGEKQLIEILTGLGGGAAVTTVAWYLLFTVWKRFEATNNARIQELIMRAESCERDRVELRKEISAVTDRINDIQTVQVTKLITAIDHNTSELHALSGKFDRKP